VRGIQARGEDVERVGPGQRAALNIALESGTVERGHELVEAGRFFPTRRVTVAFELLGSCERALRSGARVTALLGTRVDRATTHLVGRRSIEPGERGLAQLMFRAPVIATGGQTLLVRTGSPETTIGGGVVRSVFAPALGNADTVWRARLLSLGDASASARLETGAWALGERSWDGAMAHQEAGVWSEPTPGVAFASGRIDAARFASLTERVMARVESLSDGGAVERSRIVAAMPNRDADDVRAALDHLVTHDRLTETRSGVTLADGAARISDEDRAAIEEIRRLYETYGPAPPPSDEVARALRVRLNEARRLVKLATERGALVHISGGLFVAASAAADIEERVRALIDARGSATVGDIREALGVTRKHAVPICEYLDRAGVTRRVGNERVLCDERAPAGGAR